MFLNKLVEETLESQQEIKSGQTDMDLHAMHLIRDRILTEVGDRVRVQTDKEAVAMTAETEIVKATKGMTKIEGVQTEIRTEVTIADRVDRQKERTRTEMEETTAETPVMTETEVMREAETVIKAETRIEAEMTVGIEDPATIDSVRI